MSQLAEALSQALQKNQDIDKAYRNEIMHLDAGLVTMISINVNQCKLLCLIHKTYYKTKYPNYRNYSLLSLALRSQ